MEDNTSDAISGVTSAATSLRDAVPGAAASNSRSSRSSPTDLVTVEGKRVYEITDSGRESLKEHTEKGGFDRDADEESVREMFVGGASSLRSLIEAAKQVARLGNPRLIRATVDILDEARRDIYKLLAEDE